MPVAHWLAGILGFFVFPAVGLGAGILVAVGGEHVFPQPSQSYVPFIAGVGLAFVGFAGGVIGACAFASAFRARRFDMNSSCAVFGEVDR
jgi:hypothetical protein